MRLFVSLRPEPEAVRHLAAALAGRRTSRPDQWHVTLAFLGEVAASAALHDGIRTAAAAQQPFELHLAGGGAFRAARAVWAGLGGDVDTLSALAAAVRRACRDAGVPLEDLAFRPHVTVGSPARVDPAMLTGYCGPSWCVREVELVRSVLGKTAVHTVLERFPLYQA